MECKSFRDSSTRLGWKCCVANGHTRFQYVRCQFEILRNLRSLSEIQQALEHLPKGLDKTYERMLRIVDPKYQKPVLSCLKWLAFSLQGLTADALAEIFIMRPENEVVIGVKADRFFNPQDVLTYFSGLIVE